MLPRVSQFGGLLPDYSKICRSVRLVVFMVARVSKAGGREVLRTHLARTG